MVWNIFPYIGNNKIVTDALIFFRGVGSTTNHIYIYDLHHPRNIFSIFLGDKKVDPILSPHCDTDRWDEMNRSCTKQGSGGVIGKRNSEWVKKG